MTQAHRLLLKWARTLHVYLTMFGFVLLFFFALTGFMLNHEPWFLPSETTTGTMPTEYLGTPEDREAIRERLRDDFDLTGEPTSFEADEDPKSLRVVYHTKDNVTGAIVTSVAVIQRANGETVVTHDSDRSRERITIVEGKMPIELLVPEDKSKELPIVEKLRKDFGARGEVIGEPKYEKVTESFEVVFKAPGYLATANIKAGDGHTRVTHRTRGFNGILLDLHRGKDSGLPWSFIIDGVSILFVIVSITGLILWSSLRGRAQHGFAVLLLGTAVSLVVYFAWVPR